MRLARVMGNRFLASGEVWSVIVQLVSRVEGQRASCRGPPSRRGGDGAEVPDRGARTASPCMSSSDQIQ